MTAIQLLEEVFEILSSEELTAAANMIVSRADAGHIDEAYHRLHEHDEEYYPNDRNAISG